MSQTKGLDRFIMS